MAVFMSNFPTPRSRPPQGRSRSGVEKPFMSNHSSTGVVTPRQNNLLPRDVLLKRMMAAIVSEEIKSYHWSMKYADWQGRILAQQRLQNILRGDALQKRALALLGFEEKRRQSLRYEDMKKRNGSRGFTPALVVYTGPLPIRRRTKGMSKDQARRYSAARQQVRQEMIIVSAGNSRSYSA